MITVTDAAKAQIIKVLSEEAQTTLRVFVQGGGCAGLNYGFTYCDDFDEDDDFVVDINDDYRMAIDGASFPHKVGLHKSCHGLRGLKLGSCSEKVEPHFSIEEELLKEVQGLELMSLNRKDECCGFGGTFSVFEEAISVKMGKDKIQDHLDNGVEVITGADHSCLMHLEGLINRNKQPIKVMHIAEILNSSL